jgi:hypothetical protein
MAKMIYRIGQIVPSSCTARRMLDRLSLHACIPGGGALLTELFREPVTAEGA